MKIVVAREQVFNVPETVATSQIDSSTVYEELSGKYDVEMLPLSK